TGKQEKNFPKSDTVINGKGKYLIPGLWDMHTHVFAPDQMFPLLVANGITGIRDMFGNIKNINQWRQRMQTGSLLKIDFFAAGPIVDGPKPVWAGSVAVGNAEEARRAVDSVKNILKTDFVKVYSLLSRESYLAIAAESKKQNFPFAGHVPPVITVTEAAKNGQKSQEHLNGFMEAASDSSDFYFQYQQGNVKDTIWKNRDYRRMFLLRTYNQEKLVSVLNEIKGTGTMISPTLTVNYGIAFMDDTTLLNSPRMQYMGVFYRNFWDYRKDFRFKTYKEETFRLMQKEFTIKLKIVKAIHDAGIPIIAGTDFPNPHCYPGFSLHDELQWYVKAGLSPAEALRTATLNPALYFNIQQTHGTVSAGKTAHLVLLNDNPLHDIANTQKIEMVIVGGKVFTRKDLDELLDKIKKMTGSTLN
ncbi:MAG: amidohydrolase family protein, partial [Chitinophagaceae bacterium]